MECSPTFVRGLPQSRRTSPLTSMPPYALLVTVSCLLRSPTYPGDKKSGERPVSARGFSVRLCPEFPLINPFLRFAHQNCRGGATWRVGQSFWVILSTQC